MSHSIAGFEVQAVRRPPILLAALAKVAVARADTMLFAARLDGCLGGTAAMSVVVSSVGKIAHLYIASTHLPHRGRGIQLALIRSRLAAAQQAGCTTRASQLGLRTLAPAIRSGPGLASLTQRQRLLNGALSRPL